MDSIFTITPEVRVMLILYAYMVMIMGLLILVNHVPEVANSTEEYIRKKNYNLRDLPRVNYKEVSSDDEDDMVDAKEDEEENSMTSESENEDTPVLRNRRERNPMGRMLDEVLN